MSGATCPAIISELGLQKEEPAPAAELVDGKIVYKDPAEAELEKKKARAARFGVPLSLTEDKKRDLRAQRYRSPRSSNAWSASLAFLNNSTATHCMES